jgi:helix-turn-helix protein
MTMHNPQTVDEWQAAVDGADFLLLIDSARQYGLIEGGPKANVDRCVEILTRGVDLGIFPSAPDRRRAWLGRWLRAQREGLGAAQPAVAQRMGTHQVRISLIERGKVDVGESELERLRGAIEAIRKE